ncbi:MAG: HAMP domain-containing histidine kinase [Bacteroidales bacterium]|nr:HAMP domain-containing histidine kinase [Bacteroidales bacterium]
MKNHLLYLLFIISFFSKSEQVYSTPQDQERAGTGINLVIASYNPDTKRMSDFVNAFQNTLLAKNPSNKVMLQDMGFKNFQTESHLWCDQLKEVLSGYEKGDLRSVVFLGQEAWASYLTLSIKDSQFAALMKDIPTFAAFASLNGIEIPKDSVTTYWDPVSISVTDQKEYIGYSGGYLNVYDFSKNIGLIKTFFPNVSTIALLTDNTYGGASIKSLVKTESRLYPEIDFHYLDGRLFTEEEVTRQIDALPENSVILLGTWRVNKKGQYFLGNSLQNIISGRVELPVFSLTGLGLGSLALGGYIPEYNIDPKEIARQIDQFYIGNKDEIRFIHNESTYSFDQRKLTQMGVQNYQLPANSVITDSEDPQLKQYKQFLYLAVIAVIILISLVIFLAIIYTKNRNLRRTLEKNEKEILEAKERAEEGDKLKSAFLANMSHEIRTPLNAIVGFSQLMSEESCAKEDRISYSSVIAQNSEMLLTLISDILDISKMDTGKFELDIREVNLKELCNRIFQTTTHLKREGVEYICKPHQGEVILKTDLHRISQVLINLITNSNKFTEKGSITLGYELRPEKGDVLFTVTDTGRGIPAEKHSRLFARFEKLDEYTQGAGLGLAISKQIVTRLGGKIWIDPDYTNGARFCFTHPL